MSTRSLTTIALSLALTTGAFASDEWESLFDGHTLDGWTVRGGEATYHVEEGMIVGTTVTGSPNTFLCTDRVFGDFVLELEYKVHPKLNSGIQVRSNSDPDYRNGVVHGYQVEIDPSDRSWSAGIYDESRRGWLDPLDDNEAARNAFKQDDWNHYRIEANGDHLRTWINGVPAADLRDAMTMTGFIGLQVHGTNEKEPMQVTWRNIRIQDRGRHVWRPLFDGRTLDGWSPTAGGHWDVRDGAIVGTSEASESRHGLLISDDAHDDFVARVEFRITEGDSGFYFRAEPVDHPVGVHGFQVEIDTTYETGGLYETGGRTWVVQHPKEEDTGWFHKGKWNRMNVSAHGRDVVVHLNGKTSAELTDDPGRTEGRFALQLHGGQDMHVEYRSIELLVPETVEPAAAAAVPEDIYDESADATAEIAAAIAQAGEEHTRVLIQWGANWCSWCHLLHGLFESNRAVARKLLYEYEVVLVDVGRWDKHMELVEKYGADLDTHGIPYLTILDADGAVVANQDTASLEKTVDGKKGHDPEKVVAWLTRHQATPPPAESVLTEALARADAGGKRVFAYFSAPWCGWCHRLQGWLERDDVAALFGRDFEVVKIDIDRMPGGTDVMGRYRVEGSGGIPWFVFLDPDGTSVATSDMPDTGNLGCPWTDAEIASFAGLLERTRRHLDDAEVTELVASLRAYRDAQKR